ncbi:MAG: pseudouridine synthase [Candidatus Marinimicrobia bacterium]|nr:pseudouridine synthase [Candidatus Neomarinimicrobiota bacterium]|tara:strand:- start:34201 stop:34914 length:714 start_codon:yes stop_codon:yes gene_type:complete
MRLNKYLAKCGIGSRRKCDEYIKNGKIKVNGKVISDFSYNVNPGSYIQFNNKLINKLEDLTYILNKPKGYICSKKDNLDRKIIYDLIPDGLNFFSIGRLDYDTSGIIIITNDGDLSYSLSHPKFNFKKKYYVFSDKKFSYENLKKIKKGIKVGNDFLKADIKFLEYINNGYFWDVILTEGKNREIKKIFNQFDNKVLNLHRYEFAGIKLNGLKEGKYKKISKKKINAILREKKNNKY